MADKPPAEKLPLAVRKNVRDGFEAKKEDHIAKLKKDFGTDWTFDINPLAIYPYAEEGSYGQTSLGDCINGYVEGLFYNLDYYRQYHGQEGIDELNSVVPTHTITMGASKDVGSYCGTKIVDGKLAMLFNPSALGVNLNNMGQAFEKTVTAASQPDGAPSLSYLARHSIKDDYTTKIEEDLEKARKLLQNPNFKFEPDFEAAGEKLKGGKDVRDDWENNIGSFVRQYFQSFVSYLEYEKFGSDEILREGLAEGAPKGVLRFRIVDKLQTSQNGYNEIVLDNDELVVQTTPDKCGVNIYNSCAKIVDIL